MYQVPEVSFCCRLLLSLSSTMSLSTTSAESAVVFCVCFYNFAHMIYVPDCCSKPFRFSHVSGVEPMGFIWSMIPEPGQKDGRRIIKKDVTTPLTTEIAVLSGFRTEQNVLSSETVVCTAVIERLYMARGICRREVSTGRLRGTLFIPIGMKSITIIIKV